MVCSWCHICTNPLNKKEKWSHKWYFFPSLTWYVSWFLSQSIPLSPCFSFYMQKKNLIKIYAAVLGFSILPSIDPFCPLILICRVSSTNSICSFFSLHQWNLFKLTYSLLKWSSFFNSNTQFKAYDWPNPERGGAGQMWAAEIA